MCVCACDFERLVYACSSCTPFPLFQHQHQLRMGDHAETVLLPHEAAVVHAPSAERKKEYLVFDISFITGTRDTADQEDQQLALLITRREYSACVEVGKTFRQFWTEKIQRWEYISPRYLVDGRWADLDPDMPLTRELRITKVEVRLPDFFFFT